MKYCSRHVLWRRLIYSYLALMELVNLFSHNFFRPLGEIHVAPIFGAWSWNVFQISQGLSFCSFKLNGLGNFCVEMKTLVTYCITRTHISPCVCLIRRSHSMINLFRFLLALHVSEGECFYSSNLISTRLSVEKEQPCVHNAMYGREYIWLWWIHIFIGVYGLYLFGDWS